MSTLPMLGNLAWAVQRTRRTTTVLARHRLRPALLLHVALHPAHR